MAFDDPRINIAKQQLFYESQMKMKDSLQNRRGSDLKTPMIERVYRAKPGCSACGK